MDECTSDNLDSELALDLKGHKHVHQSGNSDGVYWLQEDTQSSYIVFPAPGKASADALRTFVQAHLPPHLITDDYGSIRPITEIPDDHLPVLQAHMWLSKREATHKKQARLTDAFIDNRSGLQLRTSKTPAMTNQTLLSACHITFIAGLLQSNHLFVVGTKTPRMCEFPSCALQSDYHPRSASIITIEPLVHWGTVTPVTDVLLCGGNIQAFRRNGDKCDDPLWKEAINIYTPQYPTSYCSDCLNMLLENRATAWDALQRNSASSFTAINSLPVHVIQTAGVSGHLTGNGKVSFTLGCRRTARENKASEDERPRSYESFIDRTLDASLSLDGACDTLPKQDNGKCTSNNGLGSMSFRAHGEVEQQGHSVHDDNSIKEISSPTAGFPPTNESPFTQDSTAVIQDTVYCAHTATSSRHVNRPASLPLSRSTYNYNNPPPVTLLRQAQPNSYKAQDPVPSKYSANTGSSFTPNSGTKREFGRELNTNVNLKPHKDFAFATSNAKMTKSSAHEVEDIQKFFSSALSPARPDHAESISKKAKIMLPPIITTSPEEKGSETSWETAFTNSAAKTSNGSSPPVSHPLNAKDSPLRARKSPFPFKKFPPLKFITTSKPTSPTTTPFFAKRPNPTPCPPEISSQTYTLYTSRVPTATEIICTCSRFASTPSTQIAQCANTSCVIGWYHYDCLDKSGKISARHGRLICRICKNEQELKEKDKEMGWTVEKMVDAETKMPFDGKEILANLPGVGGVEGVVAPYGFGVQVGEVHVQRKEDKGALGELAFLGYVESKPKVLAEVYTQPGRAGDRMMVEMEMEELEEGQSEDEYWEYSDECEEGFAEGIYEDGEEMALAEEMDLD
ncbi:hypothetical protein BDU57DRAFT_298084 [Ampelomyces quisqualis]|uniref:Zinc finger PHD-type domain-containing protein n=1 Tax=Ampelomyces quisqualis TaxID=50730 RepID=A0A6A5QIA6_AMPQU|nr:hypothetical protein BDU57DRAFT_298084 [Ampelomyces quisqualis]